MKPLGRLWWCHQACHTGSDMSPRVRRLAAASVGTAGSLATALLAGQLCGQLDCCRQTTPTTTVACQPALRRSSCRLLWAAGSRAVPSVPGKFRALPRTQVGPSKAEALAVLALVAPRTYLPAATGCLNSHIVRKA